jgi:hypothetical protein
VSLAPSGGDVLLLSPGAPPLALVHEKGLVFRHPRFSDATIEFVLENGQVKGLKQKDPSGEVLLPRR